MSDGLDPSALTVANVRAVLDEFQRSEARFSTLTESDFEEGDEPEEADPLG